MRSQKKRIRHRYINCVMYVLSFIAALTGVGGILGVRPVLAAEESVTKGSISLVCPVEEMELSLYRVADYEETGEFVLTDTFRAYPISLKHEDQAGWQGTADVLADYIRRDGIGADKVSTAGEDRKISFTDLTRGLYLVQGNVTEKQEAGKTFVYEPQVSLLALPDDSLEGDPYQVTAVVKYDKKEKPEEIQTTRIHVLKVWKGDNEEKRPQEVKVDLLKLERDGRTIVADSQVLNKANQWSYTWENLSSEAHWSVVESQVPEGYYVSTTREGHTIVVTNTAKRSIRDKNNAQDQSKKPGAKLPQTGQLWWPVLVLLIAGIVCILAGVSFSKRKKQQD